MLAPLPVIRYSPVAALNVTAPCNGAMPTLAWASNRFNWSDGNCAFAACESTSEAKAKTANARTIQLGQDDLKFMEVAHRKICAIAYSQTVPAVHLVRRKQPR